MLAAPAMLAVLRWNVVPPTTVDALEASTLMPVVLLMITLFSKVAVALFVHLPAIIVFGQLGLLPFSPGGEDSGGIEIIMLGIVTLPSCLFYGCVGWLLAKAMEAKNVAS